MPSTVENYKLFIASPGGLDPERQAIRDEVAAFNEKSGRDLGLRFEVTGWKEVSGGMGRPQELINRELEQCDYMILMLASRWGMAPMRDGQFSSGTEEEFNLARECINRATSPMADILVLFKGVPEEQLRDPGPQLSAVLDFKQKLEDSKEVFFKTFDDPELLRREVALRLHSWAREREAGAAVGVLLRHPSGTSTAPGAGVVAAGATALLAAEAFEAGGLMTQAEAAYAEAIADADLESLQKYARFLRRTGRLTRSLEINERILSQLTLSDEPFGAVTLRARILTSIGIVHRKLGDLRTSRYKLHEAVQTAKQGGDVARDGLAYALDNLGITASHAGDNAEALDCFQQALAIREDTGDSAGRAFTLTNLARLHRTSGSIEEAKTALAEAMQILGALDDRPGLAAAHSTMGEILDQEGRLADAERSFRASLANNEASGRPDSIAMSLNQLGRILMRRGDLTAAERHAERALRENESISNREGIVQSTHLLGTILGRTDRTAMAVTLLQDAAGAYGSIGNRTGEAWARFHLAEVLHQIGDDAGAYGDLAAARALVQTSGDPRLRDEAQRFAETHGLTSRPASST
ncbi:tetratricopeptide repeat protein [Plantactinospora sp. S1510]|uniref:Tetratricopeptide repeat protein n=1 Tax=Plantactinospora alkalitolerans TaxID=2789879 RepID=A0ABS0GTC7_9ACTN|nr:tetratricopeptide repeat protein [Plantactinospora alkalitolerans]MBF9129162.1 tetratricopeptide repeat protein [Plantactinospora alkalitolerans]